jgi:hypothetical protein
MDFQTECSLEQGVTDLQALHVYNTWYMYVYMHTKIYMFMFHLCVYIYTYIGVYM